MARKLDVYLHGHLAGTLTQRTTGQLTFRYAATWLEDRSRVPLSQSLPLREQAFSNSETRPFFAGLLPEGGKRDLVARALGVSARNDFALLDRIGGECAGAVTLLHSGEAPQELVGEGDYRQLATSAGPRTPIAVHYASAAQCESPRHRSVAWLVVAVALPRDPGGVTSSLYADAGCVVDHRALPTHDQKSRARVLVV